MRKKIFGITVMTAIAVAAGWNMNQNSEISLSDLALDNVEALAQAESSGDFTSSTGCIAVTYPCSCGPHTFARK